MLVLNYLNINTPLCFWIGIAWLVHISPLSRAEIAVIQFTSGHVKLNNTSDSRFNIPDFSNPSAATCCVSA